MAGFYAENKIKHKRLQTQRHNNNHKIVIYPWYPRHLPHKPIRAKKADHVLVLLWEATSGPQWLIGSDRVWKTSAPADQSLSWLLSGEQIQFGHIQKSLRNRKFLLHFEVSENPRDSKLLYYELALDPSEVPLGINAHTTPYLRQHHTLFKYLSSVLELKNMTSRVTLGLHDKGQYALSLPATKTADEHWK